MPLAIAGLALSAIGTGMSMAANEQSKSAISAARARAVAKQEEINKKAQAATQKNINANTLDQANADMATGAGTRKTAWDELQLASQPIASALPATGATDPTSKAQKRSTSSGNTWNDLNATAAAREGGYSDWQTTQAGRNADTGRQLSVLNNFAQGNARLLPTELEVASHAGDALSGWGHIVSTIGSISSMAGSSGSFGSSGAAVADTGVNPNSFSYSPAITAGAAVSLPSNGSYGASPMTLPSNLYN